MRRFFVFDDYNTWLDWNLTLTAKDTPLPEPKTNYVELDGANGTLDLSEALAGEVVYNDRTVTASFWSSEGTYEDRCEAINRITAALHGKKVKIIEPDAPEYYFWGRVKIKDLRRSQVHVEFGIEAICDPWRYAITETNHTVTVSGNTAGVVVENCGVRTVCPDITVTGSVTIVYGDLTFTLGAGTHKVSDFKLRRGSHTVSVSGTGTVIFTYREATL